jgi:hypothetical protein
MRRISTFALGSYISSDLRRGRRFNFLIALVIIMKGADEYENDNRRHDEHDCCRERFHFGFLFVSAGLSRTPMAAVIFVNEFDPGLFVLPCGVSPIECRSARRAAYRHLNQHVLILILIYSRSCTQVSLASSPRQFDNYR